MVKNSTGQYGTTWKGINTVAGMTTLENITTSTDTIEITGNTSYYSAYSDEMTIYYPSSTSSCDSSIVYRNNYVRTADAISDVVLSNSRTGTSNDATITNLSGTTLEGFSVYSNSYTVSYDSVASAATASYSELWAISGDSVSASFLYNSNTTTGSLTVATATAETENLAYCVNETTATVKDGTISVPEDVLKSVGKYNSSYHGVASSTGTLTTTSSYVAGNTYYAVYSSNLTMYRPTSLKACGVLTYTDLVSYYRNEWFISNTATSQTIADSDSSTTAITSVNGIFGTFAGLSWDLDYPYYYDIDTSAKSDVTTFYAVSVSGQSSAAFYYNSNTDGSLTVSSVTQEADNLTYCVSSTASETLNGSISVPDVVINSVGKYNSAYGGVVSGYNTMDTVDVTSSYSTYYAVYSTAVTVYYPSSSRARTSMTLYRNEYFTSDTEMGAVLASNDSSVENASNDVIPQVSGYSFYGLATTYGTNTITYASIAEAAASTYTTLYSISYQDVEGTFYYWDGEGVATATANANKYLHCTSSGATTSNSSYTFPTEVTSSTGPYGNAYVGVQRDVDTTPTVTVSVATDSTTLYNVFWAVYRTDVTVYYPDSTSTRASTTLYRRSYFTSTTEMNTVLTSNTVGSTTNASITQVSDYSFYGFATTYGTNTRTFSSVEEAAASTYTTLYSISYQEVEGTFYYWDGDGVTTATANGNKYLRCTSSAATTSNGSYTFPTEVTSSTGPYGNAYVGVQRDTDTTPPTTTTVRTTSSVSYTVFWAVYRTNVTNYYYSSSSWTIRTLYRNSYFTSTTAMSTVLSTSTTGRTNYTTAVGPGSSTFYGLASTQTTTRTYSTVSAAAESTSTTLYTIYQMSSTYSKGSNVSAIGATSKSCRLTYNSTSCSVTTPSITPDLGYKSVGWSTTNGDTTGTAASSSLTLSTNSQTYYGNAVWDTDNNIYEISDSSGTVTAYKSTLSSAVSTVTSGGTIKALADNSSGAVTINKAITLDNNGKKITMTGLLTNSGTGLNIIGSGTISGEMEDGLVYNTGTLTLTSGTFYDDANGATVANHGTLVMDGGKVFNTVDGTGIYNASSSSFVMNDGSISVNTGSALVTSGDVTINNGNIESSTRGRGIYIYDGNVTINGGTVGAQCYGVWVYTSSAAAVVNLAGGEISVSGNDIENPEYCTALGDSNQDPYATTYNISGGNLYSSGYSLLVGTSSTAKITGNNITNTHPKFESLTSALWNEGTTYLGWDSDERDPGICGFYVDVASSNGYAIYNTGTLTHGCFARSYSGSGGYTIYNVGEFNLKSGSIYYNNTSSSSITGAGTKNVTGSWGGTSKADTYTGFKISVPYQMYSHRTS